jgi:hypothetical protein
VGRERSEAAAALAEDGVMKFGETIKLVDPGLVVTRRNDAWLVENDHPVYSTLALSFAHKALQQRDRKRKGTISASSLGECARYQQFVFLGMPKLPMDPRNVLKVTNGAMMHLRWQMAGLTEGWLRDAEVPVHDELLKLTGTMDGLLYEGSILELKSINLNGFSRVKTYGPLIPHLFQMATYMLCTEISRGVFIYECKDNQEYEEIVVNAADLPLEEAAMRAGAMWAHLNREELYEPLEKCIDQDGWVYRSCPFRDRCLKIHTWEEAR